MPESYRKINYTIRPAKCIERKMLCEAFRKLSIHKSINSYRYIGFGSTYFSDFTLFHKNLGITKMISIEGDVDFEERFNFNKPFGCIEMQFGMSTDILPALSWDELTILWLDYDGAITKSVLADIKHFCINAIPGSIVLVSINVQPEQYQGNARQVAQKRLNNLKNRVGEEKVPGDIWALGGWKLAEACQRIISNQISESLYNRNAVISAEKSVIYKQLFNFNYKDGAMMLTVGGIILEKDQLECFNQCNIEELPFISLDCKPFLIDVPHLTFRELRFFESQLPVNNCDNVDLKGVPKEDIEKFALIYRYYPTFAETEF